MININLLLGKKRKTVGGLFTITLPIAIEMKSLGKNLIPGKTLCPSCKIKVIKEIKNNCDEIRQDYNEDDASECSEFETVKTQVIKEKLNKTLHDMVLSPFKMHAVPDSKIHRFKCLFSKRIYNKKTKTRITKNHK